MAAEKEVTLVIRARDRTRAVFRRISGGFRRLRLNLASFIGGVAFSALTRDALNFATSIEAASDRLGIAGDTLEALKIEAADAGIEFSSLVTLMQRVSRRAGEATSGSENMARAFEDLGIGFDVLRRGDPEEIFFAVTEAARTFQGTLGELQAAIQRVGDVEAVAALGFLRRGEESIRSAIQESERAGRVLGRESREELARQEQEARRELIEIQQELNAVIKELIPVLRAALPVVRALAEGLGAVAERRDQAAEQASRAVVNIQEAIRRIGLQ